VADGPDVKVAYLRPGDRFLLCTDGLTGVVEDEKLAEVIAANTDPQKAAEDLVKLALDCDSKDNVSCVLIYVEEAPAPVAYILGN
jgi:protein phosphatase